MSGRIFARRSRAGHLPVVDYLVSRGANVTLAVPANNERDSEMRSAVSEASKYGRSAVIQRLRELQGQQTGGR
jgi:ankyrin repeat protein